MNDSSKKLLVVSVGLIVTMAVVGFRTFRVLKEVEGDRSHHGHQVKVTVWATAPSEATPRPPFMFQTELPPGLHGLKLATVVLEHDLAEMRRWAATNSEPLEVRQETLRQRANVGVVVIDELPNKLGNWTETLYFVSTGPLPAEVGARRGDEFTIVSELMAEPAASSLRVGDILLGVDDLKPGHSNPCDQLTRMSAGGTGVATFHVVRDGQAIDVGMTRNAAGKFGYRCISAPFAGP